MSSRINSLHCYLPPASWLTLPWWTGTSGSRLQGPLRSTAQHLNRPQEYPLPLIPRQQPIHQPMPPAHDLARHLDDRVHEPLELHRQQPSLLFPVKSPVAEVLEDLEREPCLQVPRQTGHRPCAT